MKRPGPQFHRRTLSGRKLPLCVSNPASRNESLSADAAASTRIRSVKPSPETAIVEYGGSASVTARPPTPPRSRTTPSAVSITASSLESPPVSDATYSVLPSGESAKSAPSPVRMLPITWAASGSTSQTRPPGSPAAGLGSSTYSQPGWGFAQFSTSMFPPEGASFCVGGLVWPPRWGAWARAAKHIEMDTNRRKDKDNRRFAFIHRPRNFRSSRNFRYRPRLSGWYRSSDSDSTISPPHLTSAESVTPPSALRD